ncbi:MAG TPA: hypothetical protein VJ991_07775 [Balneolales bacterium]|nr:hypothetical protein [Balneolales bacterium]
MKDVPGFWLPLLPKVMDVLAKRIEYSKMDLIGFFVWNEDYSDYNC